MRRGNATAYWGSGSRLYGGGWVMCIQMGRMEKDGWVMNINVCRMADERSL